MFINLEFEEFRDRTGISSSDLFQKWGNARRIISLRDMKVESLQVMPLSYLRQLLESVTLVSDTKIRPYAGCAINTSRMDPSTLLVPQTFVEWEKCQIFLRDFSEVMRGFCVTKGVAKCTALIAFGTDKEGIPAIAHYLPPIVESHKRPLLIDGMHRNFLVMRVGTTVETIVVDGVGVHFPCDPQTWDKVKMVNEKPPKSERFFNLQPALFRDLKWVGIDG